MRITFSKLEITSKSLLLPLVLATAITAGCGGGSTATPGTGGSSAGTAGNSAGGNSAGGNSGGGTTGSAGSGVAGSVGTGGTSAPGTGGGTAGSVGAGGNSTAGTGGGVAGSGSGGTAGSGSGGAQAGRGGASAGSTGTAGSTAGTSGGGTTGTGGGGATGTGGTTAACPANKTFCSDFETAGLPAGAIYMVNAAPGDWGRDFAIDTTQKHGGSSSLLVKSSSASGSSGSAYRMLAVPGTAGAFWVRFWVRSEIAMGGVDHNAFAGGSIGSTPNDTMIEFAEDVGLGFNTQDSDVWPTGYGRLTGGGTNPYSLPANTWACVEISYNGTGRVQQLFINGTQLINATSYPSAMLNVTYFKFGFNALHGPPRQMWYDDVAVAPTRIGGCN